MSHCSEASIQRPRLSRMHGGTLRTAEAIQPAKRLQVDIYMFDLLFETSCLFVPS